MYGGIIGGGVEKDTYIIICERRELKEINDFRESKSHLDLLWNLLDFEMM